jgi:hypothetical protein
MSQNLILDWFQNDEQLCRIINQISATNKSLEDQALDAFHQLSELYDLPKYPADFTDEHYERF